MRLLILLVIVGVCLVSAKYLPDETNNFKQLLSRHKRSDSEDSVDESSSNDTDNVSDEELREQTKLHARLEKMRQKLLEKQEKERRRQEEAQQKLEEKIARELQKEEDRRQKEEEKRQKELQKEEERRQKELQKEEAKRQKEEEKRLQDLQKHEEKLEKERKKLEEQQKKLWEKALENERKQQEMLQQQLDDMEEETLKLQEGDNNSSDSEADESTELEDFWKSYIYSKYGLNENNTDLEKRLALRRYMQEELGLNINSTESERRQAILHLIESKWQAVSEQYTLQSQMTEFVNRVGVQKIRTQLEKEIEEINNKTDTLNNVNLPWVPLARNNFAEQVSFLQTIREFLASIVPNWYNENTSSTESTSSQDINSNEKASPMPSENQNQEFLETSFIFSGLSNKDNSIPNNDNSNDINASNIPILLDNSGSNLAIHSSLGVSNNNSLPTIGSGDPATEGFGNIGTDIGNPAIETGAISNKPIVSDTVENNDEKISTSLTGSIPDNAVNFADVIINSKNEVDTNVPTSDKTNLVAGTNSHGVAYPISERTTSILISNKDSSSPAILSDPLTPGLASTTSTISVKSEQDNYGAVNTNVEPIANQDSLSISVSGTNELINSVPPSDEFVSVSDITVLSSNTDDLFTSKTSNNIVNEGNSDSILPSIESGLIETVVNNNLPLNDGLKDNINVPADIINVPSGNQVTSVTTNAPNNLSILITKIMSSVTTTEGSVVSPGATDFEKKVNSDTPQSLVNTAPVSTNDLVGASNPPLSNGLSSTVNILRPATDSNGLNIITNIDGEINYKNNAEDNILPASNIDLTTGEAVYSSTSSTNDNYSIVTLPQILSSERQESASSTTNDSTNTSKTDTAIDPITTVITESSNIILTPTAESALPIVKDVNNDNNEKNITMISTISIDNVDTDKILSVNITPINSYGNDEKTISAPEIPAETPKVLVSIDNQQLKNVDLASKVEDQNVNKTLNVSENQTPDEPLTFINNIVSEGVISSASTIIPSSVVAEKVDVASQAANVLNTAHIISSDIETTKLPDSETDTQTTVLDQSTSIVSDVQQLTNNDVAENQFTEKDVTSSDTGISFVTETMVNELENLQTTNSPNESTKELENGSDNTAVPIEHGASIIAVTQQ